MTFREYFALNPSSLYPGSCSFGPRLPSTPQFGDFIAYHNFCYTYHAKIFRSFFIYVAIAPSTKAMFLEDWGLDVINVPFLICHPPAASVYHRSPPLSTPGALTVTPKVPMGPQTCWKSCGTLPFRSWTCVFALKFRPLRGRSCAVPAGPI